MHWEVLLVPHAEPPQWQPISRLPGLIEHIAAGVRLAREHLELLEQARGAYRLSNADVGSE